MIDLDRLGKAAGELKAFDVDESGWPGESDDFLDNAARLLAGLEEDLSERDFTNPLDTEYRTAPHAVIAALRLGRWTGQAEGELSSGLPTIVMLAPTPQAPITVRTLARGAGSASLQRVAFAEAARTISGHLRDCAAESGREWYARNDRLSSARRASRLLLYSAQLQAEAHDFFLFQALDGRLGEMRAERSLPTAGS